MTILRSILFLIWFVVISVAMHVAAFPMLFLPRQMIMRTARLWVHMILFGLKWITGIDYEVRGAKNIPAGAALVAVKHYAMWETLAFMFLLRDPAIVLKR